MTTQLLYLDSSALVKLVLLEPESEALRAVLTAWPRTVSSSLAQVEAIRAVRRYSSVPPLLADAEQVVASTEILDLSADLLRMDPPNLRSLDAIHLASALSLGNELEGLVTYDDRLAQAARVAGVSVLQPR